MPTLRPVREWLNDEFLSEYGGAKTHDGRNGATTRMNAKAIAMSLPNSKMEVRCLDEDQVGQVALALTYDASERDGKKISLPERTSRYLEEAAQIWSLGVIPTREGCALCMNNKSCEWSKSK